MAESSIAFPAPGRREHGRLTFEAPLLAGHEWPYIAVSGATDGPTLCLLAGIHAAEYPPIDAVLRFCQSLDPAALRGRLVAIPVVNLPAFWARSAFVNPIDGKNPNRIFPGDPAGTFTEVLAHHIFSEVIRGSDYLVDLHGGDMVEDLTPFSIIQQVGQEPIDSTALAMATAFGLPYLVVQSPSEGTIGGTTIGAAAQVGIPALLPEAGGVGQLQPEAVALHLRGVTRLFQHLEMLDGRPDPLPDPMIVHTFDWVRVARGGFFRREVSGGDRILAGSLLGRMVDLWGQPQEEVVSPCDGVVLFVTTSPAVGDGGLIAGIGVLP